MEKVIRYDQLHCTLEFEVTKHELPAQSVAIITPSVNEERIPPNHPIAQAIKNALENLRNPTVGGFQLTYLQPRMGGVKVGHIYFYCEFVCPKGPPKSPDFEELFVRKFKSALFSQPPFDQFASKVIPGYESDPNQQPLM